jgi:hypothetical protein
MQTKESYESLYQKYRDDSAILRNEKYAYWSLPTVFADPDVNYNRGKQNPVRRDFQSVGAILTNQLASKMASLLFPSNQSFFRLDAAVNTAEMTQAMGVSANDLASGLATLESTAYRRIFLRASYHQLVHTMKLLITTGNALLYRDSPGTNLHAYSMRQYALCRDGSGKVLDTVLKERTTVGQLPASVQGHFGAREEYDSVCLYTRIKRERRGVTDVFVVTQSVENLLLDTHEEYPEAVCPYIPVTWNLITGENYGRGLVEDYAGDFAKLSAVAEALALYEIEACRVLHLAAPGAGGDVDAMAEGESGQWFQADPTKVQAYEAGDFQKINALVADLQSIFQRLSPAFMYAGNTRDAERVTAEEIRQQAEEANQSLGGVYSVIADGLHIPLAHILCAEVNPEFVSEIIAGGLTLSVLTGVAALGRSSDVTKLLQVAQVLATILPVFTQASQRLDPERTISKVFEGFGLNIEEYSRTEEELQALQEQNAAQAQVPVATDVADVAGQISPQGVL